MSSLISDPKIRPYILIGSGVMLSGVIAATYYYFFKKDHLSEFHMEYIQEISKMLKKNQENEPTAEIIGHIHYLINDLCDELWLRDNKQLDQDRINSLGSPKDYQIGLKECMDSKLHYMKKAEKIIFKSLPLKYNSEEIKNILEKLLEDKKNEELYRNSKLPFKHLPEISKEKLKQAYVYYSKKKFEIDSEAVEKLSISKPQNKNSILFYVQLSVGKLKDEVKDMFKIDQKYLDQLIVQHNLFDDKDVIYWYEKMKGNDISF